MVSDLYVRFLKFHGRMNTMEKFGFWGSLSSIVGLAVAVISTPVASIEKQVVSGNNNTVVGENHGSINISYGDSKSQKSYVVRNRSAGVTLMVSEPNIDAVFEPRKHVCNIVAGMEVRLTGRNSPDSLSIFKEVEVLSGDCAGKYGWVATE
ncbi:hypothetical protein J7H99_004803, partial [Vibrio parahaemolyticus]|nr:hypothetical protein [Vibrio parahaemolyticus]EMA9070923.1 hypothetical protein [Vibrio parahaemolyticus]